ncbi:MAG TPA: hypothetical protein DHV29_05990 [Bacteroidales bacterium]|nr:hypothetical protein [Bacteroidales bacterium]
MFRHSTVPAKINPRRVPNSSEGFLNRPEHGTVGTTAKTTVPCPFAPSSLSDGGMLFLLWGFRFEKSSYYSSTIPR